MVKPNLPTRPWVPQWLGIVTMFIVIFPITLLNGAYTGSMIEVSNTLGVMSEDITMAYYSASVGMAVAYPIVPKIRAIATSKTLLLTDLLLQVFFSLICAQTGSMDVIMGCCFFMGFLKGFVMLEFIILIRPLFSPKNIRSEFYAYFYPIVFSGGQLSMAITAQLAYHYQWQHMYYFVTILLLVAILFVLCFFRYAQRPVHIPFKEMDGKSMFIIAAAYLLTLYTFTYGKTLDWFASPKIRVYVFIIPLLIALFIYRQRTQPKPFVSLKPLTLHKSIIGYGFMVLAMFLTATSSLVTNYMNSIIRGRQHSCQFTQPVAVARLCRGSDYLFLVVPMATVAVSLSDFRRHVLLRHLSGNSLLWHNPVWHLRNALPSYLIPRSGHDGPVYRIRRFCRRRFRPAPDTVQRFLPDFLPVGTGTGPVGLVFQ